MSQESTSDQPSRSKLASQILGGGTEPDPRFSLANERTFLAWIRTSLALLAGGVGLEAFARDVFPAAWRQVLAIGLISLGILLSCSAAVRWLRIERAMRQARPLPLSMSAVWLSLGLTSAAVAIGMIFLGRNPS